MPKQVVKHELLIALAVGIALLVLSVIAISASHTAPNVKALPGINPAAPRAVPKASEPVK